MMTLKQIATTAGITKATAFKIAKDENWDFKRTIIKNRLTNVYNITPEDVSTAMARRAEELISKRLRFGGSKLPFDGGWSSESGEAPTMLRLKKLNELSWPWGAHPAKSIIKPRELFV